MPTMQALSSASARHARFTGTRIRHHALRFALLACVSAPGFAQVTFDVSFDATADGLTSSERDNISSHLREAGRRWVMHIPVAGPRSIELRVFIDPNIPTANGASAATGFIGVIDGRDIYEQGVAYELRTGDDPNGADADANITFGLDYLRNELWFDPDPVARSAPVPVDRTDAMSIALHELGHTLAYNGWANLDTGEPPPDYWSIFDSWMIPGQPTLFAGPAATAAWGTVPDLTIGNLMHWGNFTGGMRAPVIPRIPVQPVRWIDGAPVPPLRDAPASIDLPVAMQPAGAGSLIDQLMNGVVFYRGYRYDISALDIGVLDDVGLRADVIFSDSFD